MNPEEISRLPDSMKVEDLRIYFERILHYHSAHPESLADTGESLVELADRQWHTYELIDKELREKIVGWIFQVWNTRDLNVVQDALALIGYLGLAECEDLIRSSLTSDMKAEVRKEIEDALKHFGDHLADPYYSLRK